MPKTLPMSRLTRSPDPLAETLEASSGGPRPGSFSELGIPKNDKGLSEGERLARGSGGFWAQKLGSLADLDDSWVVRKARQG